MYFQDTLEVVSGLESLSKMIKVTVWPLDHHLLLLLLLLLLCPGPPVCVVDRSILQERGKDEHEAHDQVNVYRLYVWDSRQWRTHSCTDRCHGQHGCDAWKKKTFKSYSCHGHVSLLYLVSVRMFQFSEWRWSEEGESKRKIVFCWAPLPVCYLDPRYPAQPTFLPLH